MKYAALFFLALSLAGGALNWWTAKRLETCTKEKAQLEAVTRPDGRAAARLKDELREAKKAQPAGSADELNQWMAGRFAW